MSAPAATRPAPAATPAECPKGFDPKRWLSEQLDKVIEYRPFLSEDPIQLSARQVIRWLCRPTKQGKVCTEDQAVRFLMLCKARQLNPWEGDAYLVGYDADGGPEFSLITSHQAFLKRAEAHPAYDGMDSGVIAQRGEQILELPGDFLAKGDVLLGAWAKVYRKDRGRPTYRRLELKTFNKGYSRWKADPAGMIVKCAESDALRSTFPNNLAGMYFHGEMPDGPAAAPTSLESRAANYRPDPPATNGHATGELPKDPAPVPEREPGDDHEDNGIDEPPNLPPE